MENPGKLSQWLQAVCQKRNLSLRQAAAKTGLSHTAVRNIIAGGSRPLPETIRKLAQGFGGDGATERLALENRLLVLAGYRRELSQAAYLKIIPLLSPEHQNVIQVLVRELAKIESVEISASGRSRAS